MKTTTWFRLVALFTGCFLLVNSSRTYADFLSIKVTKYDSTFTTASGSVTLTSTSLPSNPTTIQLSPGLISGLYNGVPLSLGLVDPFAGDVDWSVTASANLPGSTTPAVGQLDSLVFASHSPTATSYFLRVEVISDGYTLPGISGSAVQASATFASSEVSDGQSTLSSAIGLSTIGSTLFTPSVTSSPLFTLNTTRGANYTLTNSFDISLTGNVAGDSTSTVNLSATTKVVPEPSTVVLLLSGAVVFRRKLIRRRGV